MISSLKARILRLITCTMLFMLFKLLQIQAQPGDIIDSLITLKKQFSTSEKIEFSIKFNKHSKKKPNHVRMIQTYGCSCDDKDFCYVVYRIPEPKYVGSNRKLFINHTTKPQKIQCTCKQKYAEFYKDSRRSISAIKEKGYYMIEITGHGFIMYSNLFQVTD
jgi:hypothetical protein